MRCRSAARQVAALPLDAAPRLEARARFRAQGQFDGCRG